MHTISKIIIWLLLVCSAFLGYGGNSIPTVIENYPTLSHVTELRKQLLEIAESQIGIRELTGNNDGKEIEAYLKSVNLGKGYAWCVAFVVWCHLQISCDFSIASNDANRCEIEHVPQILDKNEAAAIKGFPLTASV